MDSIESVGMVGSVGDTIELSGLMSSSGGGLLLNLVMMCLLVHPGGGFLGILMLAVHWVVVHHLDGISRPLAVNG